jgi:hypothetical protein
VFGAWRFRPRAELLLCYAPFLFGDCIMRRLLCLLALWSALGCGQDSAPAPEPPPIARLELPLKEVFVAMERDFQPFRSWGSTLITPVEAQGETHLIAPRRIYVNAFPPASATQFPVGTMVVKEAAADKGQVRLFGMVKRGAGFNAEGAKGWEWFELKEREDKSVGIAWRGLGAPSGDDYSGDPIGTCNDCHGRSAKNDYVKAPQLKLNPDKI